MLSPAACTTHRLSSSPHLARSPSGSGKTTLLDLLAGRKTVGHLEGQIAFAGNKPTPQFLRRFTGGLPWSIMLAEPPNLQPQPWSALRFDTPARPVTSRASPPIPSLCRLCGAV